MVHLFIILLLVQKLPVEDHTADMYEHAVQVSGVLLVYNDFVTSNHLTSIQYPIVELDFFFLYILKCVYMFCMYLIFSIFYIVNSDYQWLAFIVMKSQTLQDL